MTDRTPDFLAHYLAYYGPTYSKQLPDYSRCAEEVYDNVAWGSYQCTRKNGHGPDGAHCKQHNPVAVAAKRALAVEKHEADRNAQKAKWAEAAMGKRALEAILKIAAGHNDPRTLAQSVLDGEPD